MNDDKFKDEPGGEGWESYEPADTPEGGPPPGPPPGKPGRFQKEALPEVEIANWDEAVADFERDEGQEDMESAPIDSEITAAAEATPAAVSVAESGLNRISAIDSDGAAGGGNKAEDFAAPPPPSSPAPPPEPADSAATIDRIVNIITLTSLIPIIFTWIIISYSLVSGREQALKEGYSETLSRAEVFAEHAERNLAIAEEFSEHMRLAFRHGTPVSSPHYTLVGYEPVVPYEIYVVDDQGRLSHPFPGGKEHFDTLFASHAILHQSVDTKALYIGRSVWDDHAKRWVFNASRRLTYRDGRYGGFVVFIMDALNFFDYSGRAREGDRRVFLVGRDQIIRASFKGSEDFIDSPLDSGDLFNQIQSAKHGSFVGHAEANEEPFIYSYAALHRYPLTVVTGHPKEMDLDSVNNRAIIYSTLAMILMICSFITWRVMNNLARKQRISESELRLIQTDLERRIESGKAELLATNNNLAATNTSLANLNRELGDEVERRRVAEEESRLKSEKLQFTAYHDSLTGLPSRLFFAEWVENEIIEGRSGIIAVIHLNDLQEISDAFGYDVGRDLVKTVAKRFKEEQAGLLGAIIGHLGYGRFCLAYPGDPSAEQAEELAELIRDALASITEIHSIYLHVTAQTGFAFYPDHGIKAVELVGNADNAAVVAGHCHTDWAVFESPMHDVLVERMTLTSKLRNAIKNGEFLLVYQPKLSVVTGKVRSFEALVRWHNPEIGLVSPGKFIPLAEKNGLIEPIDRIVMAEACRFVKRLQDSGWDGLTVAVNVSASQFSSPDFLDSVRRAVQEAGITPRAIEIEITETAVLESIDATIKMIEILRAEGFKIALDDFGVKYSTLSYLLKLPFDTLKIDKSFIDTISTDENGAKIVEMIISLAHLLGKEVVAEGVETRRQCEILTSLSCDIIQGFYFSLPLSETSAFEYLRREERWSV